MQPALSVAKLTKRYGQMTAVDGLEFSVFPGEVYGLIGPDGAGKTTTLRVLTGLLHQDKGSISALGFEIPKEARQMREKLGYMPQQYSLYADLSVVENLRFFAAMYGVTGQQLIEREKRLLDIARLSQFRDRVARALSGGMYKKLALACSLMHQPRLLLLDEPTNGVDPISRRELWMFVNELLGDNVAVVVSTPYMDEAERCNRVGLLVDGKLAAQGTPKQLMTDFQHTIYRVSSSPTPPSVGLYERHTDVIDSYLVGKRLHVVAPKKRQLEDDLVAMAKSAGLDNVQVQRVPPTFEDVYLSLTSSR